MTPAQPRPGSTIVEVAANFTFDLSALLPVLLFAVVLTGCHVKYGSNGSKDALLFNSTHQQQHLAIELYNRKV